jgi:hypothetical protein
LDERPHEGKIRLKNRLQPTLSKKRIFNKFDSLQKVVSVGGVDNFGDKHDTRTKKVRKVPTGNLHVCQINLIFY